jgi:hypothetical protein
MPPDFLQTLPLPLSLVQQLVDGDVTTSCEARKTIGEYLKALELRRAFYYTVRAEICIHLRNQGVPEHITQGDFPSLLAKDIQIIHEKALLE